jgi:hypothetical protein
MATRPRHYSDTSKTDTIHSIHPGIRPQVTQYPQSRGKRYTHKTQSKHAKAVPEKQIVPSQQFQVSRFCPNSVITVVKIRKQIKHKRIKLPRAESVLVVGVLLRGPAVFLRVGLLGLALQRAIGTRPVSLFLEDACGAKLVRRSSPDARAKRCPSGAEADIPPTRSGAELERPF